MTVVPKGSGHDVIMENLKSPPLVICMLGDPVMQ